MIEPIPGSQNVESETDLMLVNKLNEVISEVNNIEAKLQSASPTNIDYTAELREEINSWLHEAGVNNNIIPSYDKLASRLNSVVGAAKKGMLS